MGSVSCVLHLHVHGLRFVTAGLLPSGCVYAVRLYACVCLVYVYVGI